MKRRVWKWVLGGVIAVALAVGGLLWSAHRRADAVFERHDRAVRDAFAAVRARPAARPSLGEPEIPGNGWSEYLAALAGIAAIPNAEAEEIPSIRGEFEFIPDREKLDSIFREYAPLVEKLRISSRHRQFVPDFTHEAGLGETVSPNITQAIRTARYLAGYAQYLHEEGQDGQAVEILALGTAMAHDTGRFGTVLNHLVMIVCEGIAAETMREVLAGHSFEAKDLESFARKIDRLRDARPSIGDAFRVEDPTIRRSLIDIAASGRSDLGTQYLRSSVSERSWRYLFSRRLAYAGALEEFEALFRDIQTVAGQPTHLRPGAMKGICERVMTSKNPVFLNLTPTLARVHLRDNVTFTSMTLMRVATAIAWYESEKGRVPERLDELVPRYLPRVPACPLTGLPLGYHDGAVWSAGHNGVDDGGTPGRDNDVEAEDGDVVWQVRRK